MGKKAEIAKAKTSLGICDLNDLKRIQKVEFFQVVGKKASLTIIAYGNGPELILKRPPSWVNSKGYVSE